MIVCCTLDQNPMHIDSLSEKGCKLYLVYMDNTGSNICLCCWNLGMEKSNYTKAHRVSARWVVNCLIYCAAYLVIVLCCSNMYYIGIYCISVGELFVLAMSTRNKHFNGLRMKLFRRMCLWSHLLSARSDVNTWGICLLSGEIRLCLSCDCVVLYYVLHWDIYALVWESFLSTST